MKTLNYGSRECFLLCSLSLIGRFSLIFNELHRKAQFPQKMGYQHTAQKQHAGDSDECEERIERFFSPG